jgi:biopolymer transport protein ExbB/biopolymer transport protein TolQ
MKRRFFLSLICETMGFLAIAMAFNNFSPANNSGEEMTVTEGGQSRRVEVMRETPEGMSYKSGVGANEMVPSATQYVQAYEAFDWDPGWSWRHLSWSVKITLLILLIMTTLSIVITIDRYITFSAARNESREFAPKVASALKNQKLDEAISLSDKYKKSHMAIVVNAGLQGLRDHQSTDDISGDVINASICALQRATASRIAVFKRGLFVLSAVRSTAPFVGMFGSIFGIIDTFDGAIESSYFYVPAVAPGIAEALLTTAIGFALMTPAAWLFNYFTNKVENFAAEMENSSAELLNFFLRQRGKK